MHAFSILASVLLAATVSASPIIEAPPLPAGDVSVESFGDDVVTIVAQTPAARVLPTPAAAVPAPPAELAAVTCAKGQYLTYAIGNKALPNVNLKKAQAYFNNWSADAPAATSTGTGGGAVGATRSYTYVNTDIGANTPVAEQLYQVINPSSGNSNLEQRWNITTPEKYNNGDLTIFTAFRDLTIGENGSGAVHLQYYQNVCANDQKKAAAVLPVLIDQSLNYWIGKAQSS